MGTIAAYAIEILTALPQLIQAGIDVSTLVENGVASLNKMHAEKRDPSDLEWKMLNDSIAGLRAALHSA